MSSVQQSQPDIINNKKEDAVLIPPGEDGGLSMKNRIRIVFGIGGMFIWYLHEYHGVPVIPMIIFELVTVYIASFFIKKKPKSS